MACQFFRPKPGYRSRGTQTPIDSSTQTSTTPLNDVTRDTMRLQLISKSTCTLFDDDGRKPIADIFPPSVSTTRETSNSSERMGENSRVSFHRQNLLGTVAAVGNASAESLDSDSVMEPIKVDAMTLTGITYSADFQQWKMGRCQDIGV